MDEEPIKVGDLAYFYNFYHDGLHHGRIESVEGAYVTVLPKVYVGSVCNTPAFMSTLPADDLRRTAKAAIEVQIDRIERMLARAKSRAAGGE